MDMACAASETQYGELRADTADAAAAYSVYKWIVHIYYYEKGYFCMH